MRSASPLFAVRKMTGVAASDWDLPNLAAEFEAVFAWNHNVQDEERGPLPFRISDDGVAGGEHLHREPVRFEMMPHQAGDIRIVFDDEDAGFHGGIVAVKRAEHIAGFPDESKCVVARLDCPSRSPGIPLRRLSMKGQREEPDNSTSFNQQISALIQPKNTAGRHNRGSAVFRHDGGTGISFADLKGVAGVDCGRYLFAGKKDWHAVW